MTESTKMKVLIADDDLPTRMLLKAAIEQWGYEVIEAENGKEAIDILEKNSSPPRLLVIDWLMPVMDGLTVCELIKKNMEVKPYVILLTQVNGQVNLIKALDAGADEFLTKPFNMTELKSRLLVGTKILLYKNILAERNLQLKQCVTNFDALAIEHTNKLIYHVEYILILNNILVEINKKLTTELQNLSDNQSSDVCQFGISNLCENLEIVTQQLSSYNLANDPDHSEHYECNVNEVLKSALSILKYALDGVKLEVSFDASVMTANLNPKLLLQALTALLYNYSLLLARSNSPAITIKVNFDEENKKLNMVFNSNADFAKGFKVSFTRFFEVSNNDPKLVHLSIDMIHALISKLNGNLNIESNNGGELNSKIEIKL